MKNTYDVIVIGAGAAGLMCAIRAGECGLSVLVIEKTNKPGKKILISGGGRCNFTNLNSLPSAYLSPNPHFCKSALSRYTSWHFIELMAKHGLDYREKTLGQLFCEQKSAAVVAMLIREAQQHAVTVTCHQTITAIQYQQQSANLLDNSLDDSPDDSSANHLSSNSQGTYRVTTTTAPTTTATTVPTTTYQADKLVIACGGPSIPSLGAGDFALHIAKQFGIAYTPFQVALVPLTLPAPTLSWSKALAGISQWVSIRCHNHSHSHNHSHNREVVFAENLLFTHRGISGPAVLQISSYWQSGDWLTVDFSPDWDLRHALLDAKRRRPKQHLSNALQALLPNKLVDVFAAQFFKHAEHKPLQALSDKTLLGVAEQFHHWKVQPSGTEGLKKAEVCTGGISPSALSSKTFECNTQPGLYAVGEAVDVTGWLGGYNFQWAWSSGWCCGDALGKLAEAH